MHARCCRRMEVRRRVGLNVRKYRKDRNLSQEALGFEAGLHRTYISGLERGVRNPTVKALEAIAAVLKVPASRFLEEPAEGARAARKRS